MPSRILKESICTSDNLDRLTAFQETFFYRLIVNCDDFGRMDARPKILASRLFPLRSIREEQISDALRALTSAELVTLYNVGGKPFLQMNTWERHQQIRARKSRFPAPDDISGNQLISDDINCNQMISNDIKCNQMISDDIKCSRNPIQNESESESKRETRARAFTPPTVDEVAEYCRKRGKRIDPEVFVAFYESKGWRVGNQPMKNWKAAITTWEQRDRNGKLSARKTVSAQQYSQRDYSGPGESLEDAIARAERMMAGGEDE